MTEIAGEPNRPHFWSVLRIGGSRILLEELIVFAKQAKLDLGLTINRRGSLVAELSAGRASWTDQLAHLHERTVELEGLFEKASTSGCDITIDVAISPKREPAAPGDIDMTQFGFDQDFLRQLTRIGAFLEITVYWR